MILKLKKGKGQDTIETIDGGVNFYEGEETRIDSTRIIPSEMARIQSDYEIVKKLSEEKPKTEKQQKPEREEKPKTESE